MIYFPVYTQQFQYYTRMLYIHGRQPPVAPRNTHINMTDPQGAADHSLRTADIDSTPEIT